MSAADGCWPLYLDDGITRPLVSIDPRPISWLWPGVIARGKCTVLAGPKGCALGVSLIAADIVARVTNGGPWPGDGGYKGSGSAVLVAEDCACDTVRPRLEAAGADLSCVYDASAVSVWDECGKVKTRRFKLSEDLWRLERDVAKLGDCQLVLIDPFEAFDGTHFNGVAALASRQRVAVVIVASASLPPAEMSRYRPPGAGLVSSAWIVKPDPDEPARRLFLPVKNKLAQHAGGYAFRVKARWLSVGMVPSVEWHPLKPESCLDQAGLSA